jgi:hypothetical protein
MDGRVGHVGPNGFHALDPADAPGSCGDIRENLADFGGIALGHEGGSAGDPDVRQAIVYGLVADRSTRVRVTWRDGRTADAAVGFVRDPAPTQGAQGVFVLAAVPGLSLRRARVELLRPDGALLHAFDL